MQGARSLWRGEVGGGGGVGGESVITLDSELFGGKGAP